MMVFILLRRPGVPAACQLKFSLLEFSLYRSEDDRPSMG
jgi:hypothetical protein